MHWDHFMWTWRVVKNSCRRIQLKSRKIINQSSTARLFKKFKQQICNWQTSCVILALWMTFKKWLLPRFMQAPKNQLDEHLRSLEFQRAPYTKWCAHANFIHTNCSSLRMIQTDTSKCVHGFWKDWSGSTLLTRCFVFWWIQFLCKRRGRQAKLSLLVPGKPHWYTPNKEKGAGWAMVWCGVWNSHMFGPFFFTDTVNSERYLTMLDELIPQLHELSTKSDWFMQDGAPPHYMLSVGHWLD